MITWTLTDEHGGGTVTLTDPTIADVCAAVGAWFPAPTTPVVALLADFAAAVVAESPAVHDLAAGLGVTVGGDR